MLGWRCHWDIQGLDAFCIDRFWSLLIGCSPVPTPTFLNYIKSNQINVPDDSTALIKTFSAFLLSRCQSKLFILASEVRCPPSSLPHRPQLLFPGLFSGHTDPLSFPIYSLLPSPLGSAWSAPFSWIHTKNFTHPSKSSSQATSSISWSLIPSMER